VVRVVAVDWSGAAQGARSHIWLAEAAEPGQLVRVQSGRDRDELAAHLLSLEPSAVIGLDFAFSFPAWFLTQLGVASGPELWAHVAQRGEDWLAVCEPPFWGRRGHQRRPGAQSEFRRTELAVPRTAGVRPKSVFQVGGAGAVGTGSLRGMPMLLRLHEAGATVWPYTPRRSPVTILEIYPRLLTGPVRKSDAHARAALLAARYPRLNDDHRRLATQSEDAFDATVSALEMIAHVVDLETLPAESDPVLCREGRIWHPRWREDCL
jgi:hypothetical protein